LIFAGIITFLVLGIGKITEYIKNKNHTKWKI
jgi:hypothetical protein